MTPEDYKQWEDELHYYCHKHFNSKNSKEQVDAWEHVRSLINQKERVDKGF